MSCERRLIEEGWERRLVASGDRLSEIVELYKEIGFDVHLEPLPEKCENEECRACYELNREKYKIVYTRKRK